MLKEIFNINGLSVLGTDEQIEKYATDSKELDYIKNSLEKIVKKTMISQIDNDKFVKYGRLESNLYICVVGNFEKDEDRIPMLMVYDVRNKKYISEMSIDNLKNLKNELYLESIIKRVVMHQANMVSDEIQKHAYELYEAQTNAPKNNIPELIDKTTKTLTSKSGFYIGDPTLVLKDEILNRGVRINSKVNTGLYSIDGVKMLITASLNGCHVGHDIYSKTIGVIPIELLDKNKVKSLSYEALDIRICETIKARVDNGNLYISQNSVDVIDLKTSDIERDADSNIEKEL